MVARRVKAEPASKDLYQRVVAAGKSVTDAQPAPTISRVRGPSPRAPGSRKVAVALFVRCQLSLWCRSLVWSARGCASLAFAKISS
jgi:hypothetical protein